MSIFCMMTFNENINNYYGLHIENSFRTNTLIVQDRDTNLDKLL